MSSSGDESDKKKRTLNEHDDDQTKTGETLIDDKNAAPSSSSSAKKKAKFQTISGAAATSVAALRRFGLRFTDVDDPNALRVKIPESSDILFGRGRGFQEHPGNQNMLRIISKCKKSYKSQKRSEKRDFVEAVYDEITKDGSRFLKKLEGENCWVEVSIPISLEKVSHTLRGKRKGEDESLLPDSDTDRSGRLLIASQERRKVLRFQSASEDSINGNATESRVSPTFIQPAAVPGLSETLLPSSATSLAATTCTATHIVAGLSPMVPSLQAQLGAASQLLPSVAPNAASAFSSIQPGLAAYGLPSTTAMSALSNPFYGAAASSMYGTITGTNPLYGSSLYGARDGAASMYGTTSSLTHDPYLAADVARLQLLREQQLMRASTGSTSALMASGLALPGAIIAPSAAVFSLGAAAANASYTSGNKTQIEKTK